LEIDLDFETLRNAALLVLAAVGSIVAIRTYRETGKQRKLDNTFKAIDFLRRHITDSQIATLKKLFHANNPLAGHHDEFRFEDGTSQPVEYMFSEGGCGNGDIHNMVEVFNLICRSLNQGLLDVDLVWYEYGQIMSIAFEWTSLAEERNLIPQIRANKVVREKVELWPEFHKFMRKHSKPDMKSPMRYYVYAE